MSTFSDPTVLESRARKLKIFRAGKAAVIGEPDFPAEVASELAAKGISAARVGKEFTYRAIDDQHWHFTAGKASCVICQCRSCHYPMPRQR